MAKRVDNHPIPYHAALDATLLRFSSGDVFTINDACQGVQIFGGTGSGKSSGSGRALALAYLRAGFGGLVCCSKAEEADIWRKLAEETGRAGDLFVIDERATLRFNFMDYAQATIARDGFDRNLVDMLITVSESAGSGEEGGGDNAFFKDAAVNMLSAAFAPIRAFEGGIQLTEVYRFITSAPTSERQLDDPKWQEKSYCYKVLTNLAAAGQAGSIACKQICDDYGDYWFSEFPSLGDRTRSSIVATVGNTIKPFLTGAFRTLWCTRTDIVPEVCREGAIIVLDIPVRKYGKMAAIAQQLFKLNWQIAMENSPESDTLRPCFLFADESQFVMNSFDAQHLSVARAKRVCSVYITQDKPSYYAAIAGRNAEATADSLISKFQTRIFHANSDPVTNEYAANICGKITQYQQSRSQSAGRQSGGGGTVTDEANNTSGQGGQNRQESRSVSTYKDFVFQPDYFADQLRTGAAENRYMVDAILVRNGRNFKATGKHYLKAEFSQR
jgi:type IV secretory pathway TraG/TraD family ATPase VirD4